MSGSEGASPGPVSVAGTGAGRPAGGAAAAPARPPGFGPGRLAALAFAVAVVLALFHLWTAGFGLLDAMRQRSLHLAGILLVALLITPARKGGTAMRPWDVVLVTAGLGALAYIFFTYRSFAMAGGRADDFDLVVGGVILVVVIELGRRTVGLALPVLALVFIGYALAGPHLPGDLAHRGVTPERLIQHLTLTQEGVFGLPLAVMANYIVLFVLLGAVMTRIGMVQFFSDLATAIAGQARGGPAKVAIISSAFVGSINGSSIANVATTGAFTIPLMKRTGLRPHYAGAVEAAASTSGQIMPPIMGAAAFIMSEVLAIPYTQVMLAAIVPAAFYILGVGMAVHFQACKVGAIGLPKSEIPPLGPLLMRRGYLIAPFAVLLWLLFEGFSPTFAGFWAFVAAVVVSLPAEGTRQSLASWADALREGIALVVPLTAACAVVGIVVGVTNVTGFGPRLAGLIVDLSGGLLLPTLALTALTSIVLGAGLPTTAAYLVTTAIAAPALLEIGVPLLASHMFVFYFAILSVLTPPLALAGYVAAGIAGAPQMRTQLTGFRLAIPAFVAPFVFVLEPSLLGMQPDGSTWSAFVVGAVSGLAGVALLAAALEGWLTGSLAWPLRALIAASALMLVLPDMRLAALGVALAACVVAFQVAMERRRRRA